MAAVVGGIGAVGVSIAQEDEDPDEGEGDGAGPEDEEFAAPVDEIFEFTVDEDGLHAEHPEELSGEPNPTLELEEEGVYVISATNEFESVETDETGGNETAETGGNETAETDDEGEDNASETTDTDDASEITRELFVMSPDEEVVRSDPIDRGESGAVVFTAIDDLESYGVMDAEGTIEVETDGDENDEDSDDTDGNAARAELLGRTSGWVGVSPEEIADEQNPTLEFSAGETVTVVWENDDSQPHNFVVENDEGDILVETDLMSSSGETQTVEFEAAEEMTIYYCQPHAASMQGEMVVE